MTILEEVEVGLEKDNIQVILEGKIEAIVVDQDQVWEPLLTEIGLDVYDYFTIDCPNSQTEKEPEQIQHIYNLDEDQTGLKVLAADMYNNLIRENSDNAIVDHLNL